LASQQRLTVQAIFTLAKVSQSLLPLILTRSTHEQAWFVFTSFLSLRETRRLTRLQQDVFVPGGQIAYVKYVAFEYFKPHASPACGCKLKRKEGTSFEFMPQKGFHSGTSEFGYTAAHAQNVPSDAYQTGFLRVEAFPSGASVYAKVLFKVRTGLLVQLRKECGKSKLRLLGMRVSVLNLRFKRWILERRSRRTNMLRHTRSHEIVWTLHGEKEELLGDICLNTE
jgi:hypothetical protein